MKTTSQPRIENVGYLIHDIGRLMRNAFDARVRESGLTRSRWRVLVHLLRQDGLTQSELAEEMDIGKASLVPLLDGLENQGWVRRGGDARDRRVKRVYLTDKVQPVLGQMNEVGANVLRESLAGFSPEERGRMTEMLIHVKSNLMLMDDATSDDARAAEVTTGDRGGERRLGR